MRKGRRDSPKLGRVVYWGLIFFGVIAFVAIFRSFHSKVYNTSDEFGLDSVGRLRSVLNGQTSFLSYNKEQEPIAVQLSPGQRMEGFTVAGTFSWVDPISQATHEDKYSLYVLPTKSHPPFLVSLPDIQNEGVSKDVYKNHLFEPETHRVFELILNGERGCRNGKTKDGKPQLVVDAGANIGWFASYSAAAGCRSIAIEPQPRMITVINTTMEINDYNVRMETKSLGLKGYENYQGMRERVKIYNNIINTDTSQKLKIIYNTASCWACSYVSPAGPNDKGNQNEFIIPAIRLDQIIKEDVVLLKIDVEGYEVRALESGFESFRTHDVSNILIEWAPKRWASLHPIESGTQILEQLYDLGYRIYHYDLRMEYPQTGLVMQEFPGRVRAWEIPRQKLGHMNEYLAREASYGEANLWITKEY